MASARTERTARRPAWLSGVVAGLIGGVVMGVVLMAVMGPVIGGAIPALVGLDGILAGWLVHLLISVVFGVVFAAIVTLPPLDLGGYRRSLGVGAAYGVVLWVVAFGLIMPVWLSAVGFPNPPAVPNLAPLGLVGHVAFGAAVGLSFPAIHRAEVAEVLGEPGRAGAEQ